MGGCRFWNVCDILRTGRYSNLVRDFIFKFNITLEEKVDNDPDIKPFKRWYTLVERTKDLMRHLEYSRSLIYKIDPIDQKSLEEYYVENNAVMTDLKTWKGRWLIWGFYPSFEFRRDNV